MEIKNRTIILLLQAAIACTVIQCLPVKPDKNKVAVQNTFQNPLLKSGPDPWVIHKDGFYYYMNTEGNRITLYKTKTLSKLKQAEKTIVYRSPATGPDAKNLWAPELHLINNKWYLYYTAGATTDFATQRLFVLENNNLDPTQGTWVKKGQIKDKNADFFAIDATVSTIRGKNYIFWSGHKSATDKTQRLYVAELSEPWKMKTAAVQISAPTYNWEQIGNPHVNEGPEVLKNRKGYVFLVYSASGCWTDDYSLGMLSLKKNADPLIASNWTKNAKPIFTQQPANGAYGPGHNGFFKSPDGKEDWIIYHANSKPGQQCSNERNPRIQQFTWNADGTPQLGEPVKINIPMNAPSGE